MLCSNHLIGFGVAASAGVTTLIPFGTGTVINTNMTGGGGAGAAFDGTTSQANTAGSRTTGAGASSAGYTQALGKQWASNKTITKLILYGPNNETYFNGGNGAVTFKLQGSPDGAAWTDLMTAIASGSGTADVTTILAASITTTTSYLYHQIAFNGNSTNTLNVAEIQFFEDI